MCVYMYMYVGMYTHMCMYVGWEGRRKDLLQELTHVIMEAEKPHSLWSASRGARKASDLIQSESKGLRSDGPAV